MGCIYLAQNKHNHGLYVGKTAGDFSRRVISHKSAAATGSDYYFHRAIRKYGWGAFDWMVIDEAGTDTELNELEKEYIAYYKMIGKHLYNETDGGEGTCGHKFSEEHRRRLSEAHKGKKRTPEWCANMSAARKGHKPAQLLSGQRAAELYQKTYAGFISPDGELVTIKNMSRFCREHGLNSSAMHAVRTGKYKQHKGWKYEHRPD